MDFKIIFCPKCGNQMKVQERKEFCFCIQCGNKIILKNASNSKQKNIPHKIQEDKTVENEVEERLNEISFYYGLSVEKKEYEYTEQEPLYYLKAQDLLLDLSQKTENDYRIWWELCKPIDFFTIEKVNKVNEKYKINEKYFDKALDCANIEIKRKLINQHDFYINKKNEYKENERRQREIELREKNEEEKRIEEEKRQREIELKREKQDDEKKRQIEEQKQQYEKQQFYKLDEKMSELLWSRIANKEYSSVDSLFAQIMNSEQEQIFISFKEISKVLYLMIFRVNNQTLYKDQVIAVEIDNQGFVKRFNQKNILLKDNNLCKVQFYQNMKGNIFMSGLLMKHDQSLLLEMINKAKKPMFMGKKSVI